jgi:hypothetical protein
LIEFRRKFRQLLFDGGRRPDAATTIIGFDPRAVERHLAQTNQAHRHGRSVQSQEQFLQGLLEPRAKLAQRGMIDRSPLGQPEKIHVVSGQILEHAAGADAAQQPIQDHACDHARRDRRLSAPQRVFRLPGGPVLCLQDLVQ